MWTIADIDAPAQSGHFDREVFSARRAVQAGNTILLPPETALLQAIELSTADQPQRISSAWLPGGGAAQDMAMHGGNLVLLQQNYGLTVNDAQTLAPIARFEADLPKSLEQRSFEAVAMSGDTAWLAAWGYGLIGVDLRSEEHKYELQSLMRISYAVFCLQKQQKHKP